ncbi:MAG: malto-oligosyltrehalose synthase [Hyphomicrobium sp.]|jgi:(1->4)-alpha-D-glucan 1-alpha-D-glucosylmutase
MSVPSSTYRLQLRAGMTFDRAAELCEYWQRLGVTHLYLSPISRAMPGSTHGYDAISFNEIEPELGGEAGFRRLVSVLKARGLGVVLDFVPNHMGASPLNPWWHDVLEWGSASTYAGHFDVDWSAEKLLVPSLDTPYGEAMSRGEIRLVYGTPEEPFSIAYMSLALPLTPPSYAAVLARAGGAEFCELARRFAFSTPGTAQELKAELRAMLTEDEAAAAVRTAVSELEADRQALHQLHEAQVFRLAHWRASRESLTYRRFFEISDLVGMRVEVPQVFDDVHRLTLRLIEEDLIDGLRIDHLDGLADPLGYLRRLRGAIGRDDFYLVVEKILGPGEELRAAWPVDGVTGYEFIRDLSLLFVDGDGAVPLTRAYREFVGHERSYADEVLATKRWTFTRNLAGELEHLTGLAHGLAASATATRDFGRDTIRRTIVELASALPVYRTYIDAAGASEEDLALLTGAARAARTAREVEDEGALDFILQVLKLDVGSPERQASALGFATRFQQTTGPLMAKAVEDTVFYRYNRLIAVNEVGGDPQALGALVSCFHEAMLRRAATSGRGLSATATHDTKRGEDGRARLYAISECPEAWARAVRRWSLLTAPLKHLHLMHERADAPVPEAEVEWLFYQALLGAWPEGLAGDDLVGLGQLAERMSAFMQKAAREAKLRTSWTQPNEAYERALDCYVRGVLDPRRSGDFLADFAEAAQPLMRAGALTSLSQLAIKLVAPGVPDIYQGTELADFSLVDPDNRCEVDFAARDAKLSCRDGPSRLDCTWSLGSLKLRLMAAGLALRKRAGRNFATAAYIPLEAAGPLAGHVVGFLRVNQGLAVVVVVPRVAAQLLEGQNVPLVSSQRWSGTTLLLPASLHGVTLRNVITGERLKGASHLEMGSALSAFPVAILAS